MELLAYLLKVSACTVLFFAVYLLVLRKLTFFKINRFYLLLTLLFSFIIPSLNFTIEREVAEIPDVSNSVENLNYEIPTTNLEPSIAVTAKPIATESMDWYSLLPYLYFGIVGCILGIAIWQILQLVKHTKNETGQINGLRIVSKTAGFTNCSFFNYVFIDNENLTDTELQFLLKHEEVHAKQLHSIDKILLMVAKAVLWFNPIAYMYDKALEQTHEYEADESTSQTCGTTQYANLLLRLAITKSEMPLAHNFVKSPIKERIKMLFNSKSKDMKKLMYLLALPIGMGLLWGFTIDVVNVAKNTKNDEKTFTLVLDAGHGGKDNGAAVGAYSEKSITLAMVKKIKALAEAKGLNVVVTRDEDENVSLKDRIKAEGNILISLHVNSAPQINGASRNGIEMFTAPNDGSLKIAKANSITRYVFKGIQHIQGINIEDKRVPKSLALLRESKVPGIIIELGYLTNKNDFKFITNETKQNELAAGIVNGILTYKEKTPSDEQLKKSSLFYMNGEQEKVQNSFVHIEKITLAGGDPGQIVYVKSPNGTKLKAVLVKDLAVKFLIDGKQYSLAQAQDFEKGFLENLSAKQGVGRGYYYDVPGLKANEYVFWFGNEPPVLASVGKSKLASAKYVGETVYGKVLKHSYSPNTNLMDGYVIQQEGDEKLKIFIDPKYAPIVSKQIKIGDLVKVKAFNAYFINGAEFPEIGSSTIVKDNKVIFDRAKVVVDARPEGVKTDYRTLSKIEYISSDSIVYSKDRKLVSLYGKVEMNLDSIQLNANQVNINNNTKMITAKDAKITSKFSNVNISAPVIYYNLATKKYTLN